MADFSGVEVLTYCLMDNHFHLLVRVPVEESVLDRELIRRYRVLYPKPTRFQDASAEAIARALLKNTAEADEIRMKLLARMGDISAFMKTLKQRFSTWFNKSHDRFGPLWADRFKSVLVEGRGLVLQVYRLMLFGKGGAEVAGTAHIDRALATHVMEKEMGKLPLATMLRCRIRYFTEGAVIGSREFVASYRHIWKKASGRKRQPKPCYVRTKGDEALVALKNVRAQAHL